MKYCNGFFIVFLIVLQTLCCLTVKSQSRKQGIQEIKEINANEIKSGEKIIAITDVIIIDGNGKTPILKGTVIVKGNKIEQVGIASSISIPANAQVVHATGMSVLPGLIDSHFHLDKMDGLPALFLQHGVTSVRDPGAWKETI